MVCTNFLSQEFVLFSLFCIATLASDVIQEYLALTRTPKAEPPIKMFTVFMLSYWFVTSDKGSPIKFLKEHEKKFILWQTSNWNTFMLIYCTQCKWLHQIHTLDICKILSNNLHKETQRYIWFIYKGSDMDKMQFRLKMHGNLQYS